MRLVLILIPLLAFATVTAQEIRIGVVVDQTGPSVDPAMDAVLAYFETRVQRSGGVFGSSFDVIVRDGRGDPSRTRTEIERLFEEDLVHAVVCCAGIPGAQAAANSAEAHRVLTLTLATPAEAEAGWLYGLAPSERTELRAIVSHTYGEGKATVALMTLDNTFGDLPARVLEEELDVAGMRLVAVERYSPEATVLTPEALWVATRQPGAVVVWGLARDSIVAVEALRRRGYEGPVYASPALTGDLPAADVRFPAAPIQVDDVPGTPTADTRAAVELSDAILGLYGLREISPAAARAHDALALLLAAAEQAALYGVSPNETASYRLALRDAAIALPPFEGAGGRYDLSERSNQAALPAGLVVVRAVGGRLVAVVP